MNEAETRAEVFNQDHLQAFVACKGVGEDVAWNAAKCPQSFAQHIRAEKLAARLVKGSETRDQLLDISTKPTNDMEALAWRILAWGGMRVNNGMTLRACGTGWLDLCDEVAAGNHSRSSAYEAFANLRRDKKSKGLGPAYFTKLIYFLMPRTIDQPVGYIMDQWVSSAINVLVAEPIVRVGKNFVVTDDNDGTIYERYCCAIEALAKECASTPEEIEVQLMSKGGRNPAIWRKYVLKQRKPHL